MGAWGIGSFENDNAADWIDDFAEDPELDYVLDALTLVTENDDSIDGDAAEAAIAAAEIVAALKKQPHPELKEAVGKWVAQQPPADESLIALALRAIDRIKTNSELQLLWEETEKSGAWQLELDRISDRLAL
jgi:hypothetical protein